MAPIRRGTICTIGNDFLAKILDSYSFERILDVIHHTLCIDLYIADKIYTIDFAFQCRSYTKVDKVCEYGTLTIVTISGSYLKTM